MWTYSEESLSIWAASQRLTALLHPDRGDGRRDAEDDDSLLASIGLRDSDLEDESIRELIEVDWPQVVDRLVVVRWLRRDDIPFYRIDELRSHLDRFGAYIQSQERPLLEKGRPDEPFVESPWLNTGLSNLYPLESAFAAANGASPNIVRREILENKIAVVVFLARNLESGQRSSIFDEAAALARGRRTPERMPEIDAIEGAHWQQQPTEAGVFTPAGGYADIVRLVAYCEKEVTLKTFHDAKLFVERLLPRGIPSTYLDIARSERKAEIDELLGILSMSVRQEQEFYREAASRFRLQQQLQLHGIKAQPMPEFMFQRHGKDWLLRWEGGDLVPVAHSRGMSYIAQLLRQPHTDVDSIQLYMAAERQTHAPADDNESRHLDGDGVDGIDHRTISEMQRHAEELKTKIAKTQDPRRRRPLQNELGEVRKYLQHEVDWRGRPRKAGDLRDARRKSVRGGIKSAFDKIRAVLPECADHLERHIRFGGYCSYGPSPHKIPWNL